MLLLDGFFRFSGVTMLILIAIATLRDNRQWNGSSYLILACISVCGLFLGYTLDELRPAEPVYSLVRIMDVPHLVFVWLFAQSLYRTDFSIGPAHVAVGIVYCAPIFWIRLNGLGFAPGYPVWLIAYVSATSFLLAAHLIYVALRDWRDDLQVERRQSRFYFTLVVLIAISLSAMAEPVFKLDPGISLQTFTILSIWPAIAVGTYWLLRADEKAVRFEVIKTIPSLSQKRDQDLLARLNAAMTQDQVFRKADLSIANLASDLGVTQHRLRALINQTLGHRNFSEFLSTYRLDAVLDAFTDPAQADLPIQTIAFDCGFRSLPPFNRAFRAREGCSPSEYRSKKPLR